MKKQPITQQLLNNSNMQQAKYKVKSLETYAIPKILEKVEDMKKSIEKLKKEMVDATGGK